MKTKLFILFFAIVASVEMANATTYSGSCGAGLSWTLETSTGELTITGNGPMSDYTSITSQGPKYNSDAPWFNNRSFIKSVEVAEGVTTIGQSAFWRCNNLASITLPNSIISIGELAFSNCIALSSLTIPNSVTRLEQCAFEDCSSLGSVTIGNSVTRIEYGAFIRCGMTSLTIPNSVTSIGDDAFLGCTGLTSVTIPNSVTSIGNHAFYDCTGLTSIYYESSVITIAEGTFKNASPAIYVPQCAYTAFHNAPVWKDLTIVPVQINMQVANNVGGVVVETCGSMEIEAVPYIGYHFKRWQDGNKENPRKYTLSQANRNFIAEFEIDKYTITFNCDASQGSITGDQGKYNFDTEHEIEAVPNYGYHFTQWSDGETENPRTFVLEQDTIFTALFAPNKYSLAIQYNDTYGEVEGEEGEFDYLSEHTITVNAKYGYHFTQWSDGVTNNPRTLVLTKDTTITASFAPNKYSLELIADANLGEIEGEQGEFDYLSEHEIQAVPKTGCVFNGWSDGVTTNPRTIILTQDTSITALFEQNLHEVTVLCNNEQGSVAKSGETYHSAECTISATPNNGYQFIQWNDGVTDNPRTFIVTEDTTFTAEFALAQYNINANVYPESAGSIECPTSATYNDKISLSVSANEGYKFLKWSDENTNPQRELVVEGEVNLTALFAIILTDTIRDTISVEVKDTIQTLYAESASPSQGSVRVQIVAVAETGYEFLCWSDFNTENPRTVVLDEKNVQEFTAYFKTKQGELPTSVSATTSEDDLRKYIEQGSVYILRGDKVYTITGQEVK